MTMAFTHQQYAPPPPGPHMGHVVNGGFQVQLQSQPRRLKITQPSFKSRYECKLDDGSDGRSIYNLEISTKSSKEPSLTMTAGGAPIAACYFPDPSSYNKDDAKTFHVGLGDPTNIYWTEMNYRGKDKHGWTFTMSVPQTGQLISARWNKSNSVAVDGMSASRLSNNNFNLQDAQGRRMAVFTSHTMSLRPSAVGTLQIDAHLGPAFEHAVVITLLSIYDFQSREEDKRSSTSSSAAGHAAAAAASG
ncbi:hypothetical protein F66182_5781 [Fusarium sp. NRRL 66182]|nr:hypothetical protein F66182_5781 [Fusarium sp. NRRL 66182]